MKAQVKLDPSTMNIQISGMLTVKTVAHLRVLGTQLAKTIAEPRFDLQNVEHYDSSALALLTALARDAKQSGRQACFLNLPPNLMTLATLSHLDKILNFSNTALS